MRVRLLGFAMPLVFLAQCAPSGCQPAPAPTPPAGFGAGTHLVGSQIAAGTYIAQDAHDCYWERLSGLGGSLDEIITNEFASGRQIVTIEATDAAFDSDASCGRWVQYGAAGPVATFGDGDWAVTAEVPPGRWASDPTATGCYWERATGYDHTFDEIIANDFSSGQSVVDIAASDIRFTSDGCGTWTRIA
jgi:hypothetical protein